MNEPIDWDRVLMRFVAKSMSAPTDVLNGDQRFSGLRDAVVYQGSGYAGVKHSVH